MNQMSAQINTIIGPPVLDYDLISVPPTINSSSPTGPAMQANSPLHEYMVTPSEDGEDWCFERIEDGAPVKLVNGVDLVFEPPKKGEVDLCLQTAVLLFTIAENWDFVGDGVKVIGPTSPQISIQKFYFDRGESQQSARKVIAVVFENNVPDAYQFDINFRFMATRSLPGERPITNGSWIDIYYSQDPKISVRKPV